MKFRLYAGPSAWLLVPECMLAPLTASNRHGPLQLLGTIDDALVDKAALPSILAMIDADSYATIPGDMAARLERAALATHSHVILGERVHENPFFVEPLEFLKSVALRRPRPAPIQAPTT